MSKPIVLLVSCVGEEGIIRSPQNTRESRSPQTSMSYAYAVAQFADVYWIHGSRTALDFLDVIKPDAIGICPGVPKAHAFALAANSLGFPVIVFGQEQGMTNGTAAYSEIQCTEVRQLFENITAWVGAVLPQFMIDAQFFDFALHNLWMPIIPPKDIPKETLFDAEKCWLPNSGVDYFSYLPVKAILLAKAMKSKDVIVQFHHEVKSNFGNLPVRAEKVVPYPEHMAMIEKADAVYALDEGRILLGRAFAMAAYYGTPAFGLPHRVAGANYFFPELAKITTIHECDEAMTNIDAILDNARNIVENCLWGDTYNARLKEICFQHWNL